VEVDVKQITQFLSTRIPLFRLLLQVVRGLLVTPPPVLTPPRLCGQAQGYLIKPIANRVAPADRGCFARQNQEHGLEDVLSILAVPQPAPRNAPDQRGMAFDQGGKGGLVAHCDKTLKQLSVGQFSGRSARQAAKVVNDRAQLSLSHVCSLLAEEAITPIMAGPDKRPPTFSGISLHASAER
jgi:hypothetical protein